MIIPTLTFWWIILLGVIHTICHHFINWAWRHTRTSDERFYVYFFAGIEAIAVFTVLMFILS